MCTVVISYSSQCELFNIQLAGQEEYYNKYWLTILVIAHDGGYVTPNIGTDNNNDDN